MFAGLPIVEHPQSSVVLPGHRSPSRCPRSPLWQPFLGDERPSPHPPLTAASTSVLAGANDGAGRPPVVRVRGPCVGVHAEVPRGRGRACGCHPPVAIPPGAVDIGVVPGDAPVSLRVVLPLRNERELAALVARVSAPGSRVRRTLPHARAVHRPVRANEDAAVTHCPAGSGAAGPGRRAALRPTASRSPSTQQPRRFLRVQDGVRQQRLRDGTMARRQSRPARALPGASAIIGLNDIPRGRRTAADDPIPHASCSGADAVSGWVPQELATAYGAGPLYDRTAGGVGQTIALYELSSYRALRRRGRPGLLRLHRQGEPDRRQRRSDLIQGGRRGEPRRRDRVRPGAGRRRVDLRGPELRHRCLRHVRRHREPESRPGRQRELGSVRALGPESRGAGRAHPVRPGCGARPKHLRRRRRRRLVGLSVNQRVHDSGGRRPRRPAVRNGGRGDHAFGRQPTDRVRVELCVWRRRRRPLAELARPLLPVGGHGRWEQRPSVWFDERRLPTSAGCVGLRRSRLRLSHLLHVERMSRGLVGRRWDQRRGSTVGGSGRRDERVLRAGQPARLRQPEAVRSECRAE